jgi:hypothetical protein
MKKKENNTAKKALADYEKHTNILVQEFVKKYFCDEETPIEDIDYWWIGDEIGGVLGVYDDYYFDMDYIANAIRLEFTYDELIGYYYYSIEEKEPCNIKNWRHFKKGDII